MTITQKINTPRASSPTAGGGLCLNMIVKNEVKILERCLASVAPWISYYVIGDTESTDGTQDLIRSFFEARGIPGEIHEYEFENYSQARNRALEFCKASSGKFETILFVDADMELKVDDPSVFLNEPHRRWQVGTVRQTNDQLDYHNVRLLNRVIEAKYEGYTHEYLSTPLTSLPVEGIWFLDHACGSNRGEKSTRDARLLEASLLEEPGNVRSMFYLAQTYKDMGEWKKAIAWYIKRKDAGGWNEEVWYSAYMIANCLRSMGDINGFIAQSLEAYQLRPNRSEPLHALANFYRNEGKNELALIISEAGKRVPYPRSDKLFVEHGVYSHGFDEEIGISGFYAQNPERKKAGYETCMRLAISRTVPNYVRDNARSNSGFYAKGAKELFPSFDPHVLKLPETDGLPAGETWRSMNPSIAINGNDARCVLRSINYEFTSDGRYLSPIGIIRTMNRLLRWQGSELSLAQMTASPQIVEPLPVTDNPQGLTDFPVNGYEDCRIFKWKKDWWSTATVRDRHLHGQCETILFNLRTQKECVLRDFENTRHQKNWVPLVTQFDHLLLIYTADPTIVLEVDPNTLACKKIHESEPPFALSHLRGSSQAIPWLQGSLRGSGSRHRKGWIYVAHEVVGKVPEGRSRYLHRFVVMDEKFNIRNVSPSFYFIQQGVEFCAGLARKDDKLLVSFGVEDRQAVLATISEAEVRNFIDGAS